MKPIAIGQVFGKLEVVSLTTSVKTPKKRGPSRAHVVCRCMLCGKTKIVIRAALFGGNATTCGEKECRRRRQAMLKRARGGPKQGLTSDGYVRVYVNRKQNVVHRLVMEKHLGRKLESSEAVHHINGIRTDNRIENLEVLSLSAHTKKHAERLREISVLKKKVEELESRVRRLEYERTGLVLVS